MRNKLDDFNQRLLEEHHKEKRNTIIWHLLSMQKSYPEYYTDQTIKDFTTVRIYTLLLSIKI